MVEIQNTIKTPKSFPEIWQPIASAPRDGTFVLTKAGSWQPCITHFATYDGRTRWGASPEGFMTEAEFLRYWHEVSYAPTEWMPLPDDDVADAIETAYRNGFEDGERHAGEAASPSPETNVVGDRALEAALEIERLRLYCQQLLDILDNYQVEIEGEDNDLIAMIGRHVDPGYVEPAATTEGSTE